MRYYNGFLKLYMIIWMGQGGHLKIMDNTELQQKSITVDPFNADGALAQIVEAGLLVENTSILLHFLASVWTNLTRRGTFSAWLRLEEFRTQNAI